MHLKESGVGEHMGQMVWREEKEKGSDRIML